jgi:hypothetical protein
MQHELFPDQYPGVLELGAHMHLLLYLARGRRYLGGGDAVLRFCRLVVDQPQVGVGGAGSCGYPVAEARVHCVWLVWVVVAAVVDEDLERLGRVSRLAAAVKSQSYVSAHVHVVGRLGIGPDHAIRGEVRVQARRLPCEDKGAVGWRRLEVGPRNGRRVAHNLGAADQMFERLRRLEGGECRKAVRGHQMHVGKLHCQRWRLGRSWRTNEVVRHLRTRIRGRVVALVHAVHDVVCNATAMPRRSRWVWAGCVDAIARNACGVSSRSL